MSNVNTKVNHCYNYILNDIIKSVDKNQPDEKRTKTIIQDFELSTEEINSEIPE